MEEACWQKKKENWELKYAEDVSFLLDLKILLLTIKKVSWEKQHIRRRLAFLKTCIGLIAGIAAILLQTYKRKGYLVAVWEGRKWTRHGQSWFCIGWDLSKHKRLSIFQRTWGWQGYHRNGTSQGYFAGEGFGEKRFKTNINYSKSFWPKTKSSSKRSLQNWK